MQLLSLTAPIDKIFYNVIRHIKNVIMDELYCSIVGEGNVPFAMAWVYPQV
jgi:hypothetical protein